MSWAVNAKRRFKDRGGRIWYDRWICDVRTTVYRAEPIVPHTMICRPKWMGSRWQIQVNVLRRMNGEPVVHRAMHFCQGCEHVWEDLYDAYQAAEIEAGL